MSAPFVSARERVNRTYINQSSNYITLEQRLAEVITNQTNNQNMLIYAVESFKKKFPNIKNWIGLNLCKSIDIPLSNVIIDTTLQRNLDIQWVSEILENFDMTRADAIKVYVDAKQPKGTYTCWDGQHTIIALYIIAKMVFNMDLTNALVPCVINSSTQKDQMRENFMAHNSFGKKQVSKAEIHRQACLGVRIDNSTNPEWILHEKIQTLLEKHNLFVCDSQSDDSSEPGAISNMSQILQTVKNIFSLEDYNNWCMYFSCVCNSNRPVAPMEQWQFLYYFRYARYNNIKINKAYIQAVADTLNGLFTPQAYTGERLHLKAEHAYKEWFRSQYSVSGTLQGHSWSGNTKKDLHLQYLVALLNAHSNGKFAVPPVPGSNWKINPSYLTAKYCRQ